MNKIKFLNNKNDFFYCFDGIEQPDGTVKLKFKSDFPSDNVLCSGFEIISEDTNENISGDYYHNYTTIYRKISNENAVQLSKNGSVYVEANNIKIVAAIH